MMVRLMESKGFQKERSVKVKCVHMINGVFPHFVTDVICKALCKL